MSQRNRKLISLIEPPKSEIGPRTTRRVANVE